MRWRKSLTGEILRAIVKIGGKPVTARSKEILDVIRKWYGPEPALRLVIQSRDAKRRRRERERTGEKREKYGGGMPAMSAGMAIESGYRRLANQALLSAVRYGHLVRLKSGEYVLPFFRVKGDS